jgi:hypothetical protein
MKYKPSTDDLFEVKEDSPVDMKKLNYSKFRKI